MSHLATAYAGLGAAAALARAGVVRPLSPARAFAAARVVHRWGASPATAVGIAAVRWPDRVAILDDAGPVTYRELEVQADTLARYASGEHGVGPDAGLAVMCRNHRGLVVALLAAGRLGADLLLVNTELPAHQLTTTLERHRPGLVVHDDEFTDRLAGAGHLRLFANWTGDGPAEMPTASASLGRVRTPGDLILLTSGTTGVPKGVPRKPHASAFLGVTASALHRLGLRSDDTMMVCPPAFHGMGAITLLLGLALGNTVVLHRRFDAAEVVNAVETHAVTTLVAVPTMLQRLLTVPDVGHRARSLRSVLSGAAQLSPTVAEAFMDVVGDVLHDGYGSSEVGIVTLATPADLRAAPGTVGRPTLASSIRILSAAGGEQPTGEVGHVHVKGPMTFDGYSGGGHKEVRAGYVATGDLGHLDAAGRLFIDGRADDMIVSGGENVFPQPVEDALLSHPSIADAAVTGVPDPAFGQRLRAFVVLRGEELDEDAVREHLRTRLARFEMPRDIVVISEIPRNATGKVLRRQLAAT